MTFFSFHNNLSCRRIIATMVLFAISIVAVSCHSTREVVEVPVYVNDTIISTEYEIDSIYVDRYTKEYVKGDTVYLEKVEYKYVENKIHDTFVEHRDVPIEIEKIIEREKELSKFQRFLMFVGFSAIVLIVLYICKRFIFKYK